MSNIITSPEFFINMKSVPTPDSREYGAFVKSELDKLQYGVTINGVHISNWLYWHINYWKIYRPEWDDRRKEVVDIFSNPHLRDNEWIIAEALQKAKEQQKGLILIGARRLAKTTFIASWLGLGATIYEGSQNVIVGNNKGDIRNITSQMDKGLSNVESFLRYNRLLDDWKKEVTLGWKYKEGGIWKTEEWSQIHIKNTEEGTNTEVLAGLTPKNLVFDEIGKAKTKEVFLASIPAYNSPYGWRCVPILTGTGGDMIKGEEAKELFNNPDNYNLLAYELPNENRKTGLFISGLMSIDMPKKDMLLSEYLNIDKGTELDKIHIKVTDVEKAEALIKENRNTFLKSGDQIKYIKAVMYAPLTTDECFMSLDDDNPFPVEALQKHLEFLKRNNEKKYINVFRDVDGKVGYTIDEKRFEVTEFPVSKDTNKDGAIVMYEPPMPNAPDFLYIAGGDPYNQNKSESSPSLGTVHIYKRIYDPVAGTYQNRIVCSYAARPETMKDWQEKVEMLLELYNATIMIENEGTNFIQYMENKNKSHILADGYNLAKEINPKTSIQGRTKGLPVTTKIQNHYRNLIKEYCNEKIVMGHRENGEPIEALGLVRIPDEMLIVELINYKKGGNFDRIVSFGHALVYDEYLQKIAPTVKVKEPVVQQQHKKTVRSPFILTTPNSPKSNIFGI